jgi:hypothetical protein
VKALALILAVATLALTAGCGDDDETAATGASGATGAASAGDDAFNATAKATALAAQAATEAYATGNGGSYAGATAEELAKIEPSLSDADLNVVSTDSSYTVSVLSASGTTFSIGGEQGRPPVRTCDPPGDSGCSAGGDWG